MHVIEHAYAAEIVKSERDANGDLVVYGKATGPDLDLDEQIADAKWLKGAMPEWFEWGNIREMHGPVAAGIGTQLVENGDDWMLASKIVDEGAAKKVEAGVYTGYSIGIKNAKVVKDASAPGGRIVGGTIVEVSLVDRPCNPTAKMAIAKSASSESLADAEVVDETGTEDEPADLAPVEVEGAEVLADAANDGDSVKAQLAEITKALAGLSKMFEKFAPATAPVDIVNKGADTTKTSGTADEPAPEGTDVNTLVKSAVKEATDAIEQRHRTEVDALKAELAKFAARPAPGGPVLTRTRGQIASAGERESALSKAEYYASMAKAATGDAEAARGYRELEKRERARANTLGPHSA